MSDRIVVPYGRLRWARSSTRHRVTRRRTRFVIEQSGIAFRVRPPRGRADPRIIFLGNDDTGVPLEVVAVQTETGDLIVIHSMPLREKFRSQYEEAKKWRR